MGRTEDANTQKATSGSNFLTKFLSFCWTFFGGRKTGLFLLKEVCVRAPGCRDPSHISDSHSHIWGWGCRLQLDRRGWKLQGTPPPSHPGRPEPPQQQARARQRSRHGAAHGARGDAGRRGRGAGGSRGGDLLPGLRTRSSFWPSVPPRPPCRPRPGNRCPGVNSPLSAPRTERSAAPGRRRHGGVLEQLAGQRRG